MEPLRKCNDCGLEAFKEEDLELFSRKSDYKHGRRNSCKSCHSARNVKWAQDNSEKHQKTNRKWAQDNPEKRWSSKTVHSMKRRRPDSTITPKDLLALREKTTHCPVFGFELVYQNKGGIAPNSASVDRIDPSKPYAVENVQILSLLANSMKSNATPEQLLAFSDWVQKTYGDQG